MAEFHFEQPAVVYGLAYNEQKIFAATEQGLWQFENNAHPKMWTQIATAFRGVTLSAVAACGSTVLIGGADGVVYSHDQATWVLAKLPVKAHVLALALSPNFAHDQLAWAATAKDGVLRSENAGVSWHAWNFGLLDMSVNALAVSPDFAEDETLYAATEHGVFMSENTGRAWREFGFPNEAAPVTALAVDQEQVYAATEGNGLWQCAVGTASWSRVKSLKPNVINGLIYQSKQLVAATTNGVYTQHKNKWTKQSNIDNALCLLIVNKNIFVGTAGNGIYLTSD